MKRVRLTAEAKCQALAEMPGMGRRRHELAPNLQSAHVGKYIIFYRPEAEGIEVIRVIHGHRDIPRMFERGTPRGQASLVSHSAAWAGPSHPGYAYRKRRLACVAYDELLAAWVGSFSGSDSGAAYPFERMERTLNSRSWDVEFPRLGGTMRYSASLPSLSPRFVVFAWRYDLCTLFAPSGLDARPWAPAG